MSDKKLISLKKRSDFRSILLKRILNFAGFKIIRDHWLYIKNLDQNSIVIDLGANTGTFSDIMIKEYHAKCFAVEPNDQLFNNLSNPKLAKYNYAITDKNGPVDFFVSENHEASSLNNDFQDLWQVSEKQTVEGITLNILLEKLALAGSTIDILKIDVEGAELDIIDSFDEQNAKDIKQVTVEFHHKLNPELHKRTKASIKKMLTAGYIAVANTISPTEILFIKSKDFKFNGYQRLLLGIYKKLSFSPY